MRDPAIHRYPDRRTLAEALAAGVAAVLAGGIATRGRARLAVSGGSTPGLFFDHLSKAAIDWRDVCVTLVDERWVPDDHPRSNARLVKERLLVGPAAAAHFEPLFTGAARPQDALDELSAAFETESPCFDAVILGMGADGHTASFFPDAAELDAVTDAGRRDLVSGITAPSAGEPRITLTLRPLVESRFLALHIEGEEKLAVLNRALEEGPVRELPVRAVLRASRPDPVSVFWAP